VPYFAGNMSLTPGPITPWDLSSDYDDVLRRDKEGKSIWSQAKTSAYMDSMKEKITTDEIDEMGGTSPPRSPPMSEHPQAKYA
jgi:hypothetical protein